MGARQRRLDFNFQEMRINENEAGRLKEKRGYTEYTVQDIKLTTQLPKLPL